MMVLKSKLSALVFGKDQEVAPLTSDSEAIELAPTAPLVPPPSHPGHAVTYLGKVRLFPAPALGPGCTDGAVQEMWALKAEEPNLARPARLEIRPFHIRMHVQLPPSHTTSTTTTSSTSCERAKLAGEEDPEDDDENEEEDENDDDDEEEEGGVATAAVRAQRLLWRKKRHSGGKGGGAAEQRRRRRRQRRQPREGGGWRTDSFDVARVAFCSAEHRASGLVFAWLYREHHGGGGGNGAGDGTAPALSCHAVECQSAEQAKRLAHTMMEAFTRTLCGMRGGGGGGGGKDCGAATTAPAAASTAAGEGWQVATATAGVVVGGGAEDLKVSVDTGSGCFGVRP
ncbi:PTB-containing, cubilin and LRP1-interacting protein [Lethenteron reissneri]|uniref:PTB-containing, cubilin and LRP1-interacting protein n=1 Tax=Lethenteron reissneri TaxID=7753 RepID=UPI002AB5E5A4|nr:PTB-containing, cubilin and LRP1-interacting protein [Lethenteron reissneri]